MRPIGGVPVSHAAAMVTTLPGIRPMAPATRRVVPLESLPSPGSVPGLGPKGHHLSYEPPAYGSPPPPPPGGGGYGAPPPGGGGYGGPPPGGGFGGPPPGYGGAQPQQTSVLSIVSLVTGILGIVCCICYGAGGLFGIAALVTGFLGRKEIAESGDTKKGGGLALAGMICGGVAIALSILYWILFAVGTAIDVSDY